MRSPSDLSKPVYKDCCYSNPIPEANENDTAISEGTRYLASAQ
jgi:hypothetical protein